MTARLDEDGAATFVVTAATEVPTVRRFGELPDAAGLAAAFDGVPFGGGGWYTDPLGEAHWRRGVSARLPRAGALRAGDTEPPHEVS